MPRNATTAFYDGLRDILERGCTITVRGEEVREITGRLTVIDFPRERVIVTPHRKNNIFATIAETIWVLGGRNDVDFLAPYLHRAAQFSDDGVVWRAGYGPRLRNWNGTDQLGEIVRLLRESRLTRRAVLSLFDPAQDFIESKDIPCNNWLQFLIREESLAMHVAIRSNDIIWGFSGVNVFEFSVLQEMLAVWSNSNLGRFLYFAGSFHLYQRHYGRAKQILSVARRRTLYDFGFKSIPFESDWEAFNQRLQRWFELEQRMREGQRDVLPEMLGFPDPFLRASLVMLLIYHRFQTDAPDTELSDLLDELPASDFRMAAIEYLTRREHDRTSLRLSPPECEYLSYLRDPAVASTVGVFQEIAPLLVALEYKKTLVYKDSWKKRGELLGVFANIARKYDRLEAVLGEHLPPTGDESVLDTLADLAVYAGKYLTFLAENEPQGIVDFLRQSKVEESLDRYQGNEGFAPVMDLLFLRYRSKRAISELPDTSACLVFIQTCFQHLEQILMGRRPANAPAEKSVLTSDMALAAIRAMEIIRYTFPEDFARFVSTVEAL